MTALLGRITPFLNNLLPVGLALKGLENADPKLKNFIGYATSAGYASDQIMDFIRERFENPKSRETKNKLEQRQQQGNLRPDEMASLQEINASQLPGRALQKGLATGIGLAAGGLGAGLIGGGQQPQQSTPQTPSPTKSISPNGVGATGGLTPSGFPQRQKVQDNNQLNAPAQTQKLASTPFDILSQFDSSLAQFIEQQINNGQSPTAAAAIAKMSTPFEKTIKGIEKNTKKNFVDWINEIFGVGNNVNINIPQSQNKQPSSVTDKLMQALQLSAQARQNRQKKT